MTAIKSPRLITCSLLFAGAALIVIAASPTGGDLKRTLQALEYQRFLTLALLGIGSVLFLWGMRSLTRKGGQESQTWWGLSRLAGGMLFMLLAGVAIIRPLFEEDISNAGRLSTLSDADLSNTGPPLAGAADWPQWLGPHRDGHSSETGLNTDWQTKRPPEVWRKPLGGGYSSIIQVQNRLYTMDRQGSNERVVCLDATTGNSLWNHSYLVDYSGMRDGYTEGPRATPCYHDGRLYTIGATGIFHCLEVPQQGQTPRVLWRHDLITMFNAPLPRWGVACSPLIEGDLVIAQPGGPEGSVAAFHRVTGEVQWKALGDRPGYSSPVTATLGGVRQIVCFTGENVAGLRANDGKLLWSYPWATTHDANTATPILVGKCVFISSGYNKGCALLEIQGEGADSLKAVPLYVRLRKLMCNHHSNCVLHDGHLYGSDDNNGIWRCVNVRSFNQTWFNRGPGKGCLIYADGHFLILSEHGDLALVEANPQHYVEKGRFEVFDIGRTWATPTLSQGRLYLRSNQEVVCLDLRK